LATTLSDLKATQSQLIQSEKMASLGELTAGIAHEIQNPLNFVNNFSEVNKDLLNEMKTEIEKGNFDEVKLIADDVINNEDKINHHGKRADSIVKGMLLHSRSDNGEKELTDINALTDEYLRLAYHGIRAKDKSFNANLIARFDSNLPKIKLIPQDIGRVLLNLFNNSFYAVGEGKKLNPKLIPEIIVTTSSRNNHVEISVKDNGNGIPPQVADKIFQPFFTTKPTGQGTGLGLSMAYDIVKAHGGEISVDSEIGQGSTFTIRISTN
jgi:two-component system, NtrC family, sensor kinase